jgi:hypothetical protein
MLLVLASLVLCSHSRVGLQIKPPGNPTAFQNALLIKNAVRRSGVNQEWLGLVGIGTAEVPAYMQVSEEEGLNRIGPIQIAGLNGGFPVRAGLPPNQYQS